jgi:hypothetical protein
MTTGADTLNDVSTQTEEFHPHPDRLIAVADPRAQRRGRFPSQRHSETAIRG